ncbi:MAG: alpha/beta hydrolase family protein [Pirellulaceae bacterium]
MKRMQTREKGDAALFCRLAVSATLNLWTRKRAASPFSSMFLCMCLFPLSGGSAFADGLEDALKQPILEDGEARTQIDLFVLARIPELKLPATAAAWQQKAAGIRRQVFEKVVFRGVPEPWYTGQPAVEWLEEIHATGGYTIRKLRFEALPGLWIPALLYQPDKLSGKAPIILNVNGHAATGKQTPYKQIRCINQAKRGMVALNLEWIGMGQLRGAGYSHNQLAMLDLCGRSGLSVFYLAMARGLDVLLDHPNADPDRLAVTGLSGGGWQTIILSSLDTRVKLAVPVAGHSALKQRIENRSSIGDLEQNPTDLVSIADYAHLTALMTPRPTLLIYNAKDNCCFVAKTVKPNTYDPIVPFYEQAGVADSFEYYENEDPGTHNYDLDNRQQFYRFVNRHFLAERDGIDSEIPSDEEVLKADVLDVAIPDSNATFHSLAAEVAKDLPKKAPGKTPAQLRDQLRELLRFEPLTGTTEKVGESENVEDRVVEHFRLRAGQEWKLPVAVVTGPTCNRTVLFMADEGFSSCSAQIDALVDRGARVVCIDPVLIGQARPEDGIARDAMVIGTVGQRLLGVQTAQVVSAMRASALFVGKVDVYANGPRTGIVALCAAALQGSTSIGELHLDSMPDSLKEFLLPTASYNRTPEVYCFGLLEWFDRLELEQLANQP